MNLSAQHSSSVESKNHPYVLEKSIDFPAIWKGLCSDRLSSVSYLYSLYPPAVDLHLSGWRSLSGQWTATTLTWIKNQNQPGSFCTLLFSVCQLWSPICCSGQRGFLHKIYDTKRKFSCHYHSRLWIQMHVSQWTSDVPVKPGIHRLYMEYNRLVDCLEAEPRQSDACESLGTSRSRVQSRTSTETSVTWNHLQKDTDESLACDERQYKTLSHLFFFFILCIIVYLRASQADWSQPREYSTYFPPPCVRVRTQTSRRQNVPAAIANGGRKYNKSLK